MGDAPSVAVTPVPPICGARTRGEGQPPCKKAAGWGTNHVGVGRCRLHGGNSLVKHGRFAKIQHPRIGELLERFEADTDPLNLFSELALLRALLTDFIERHGEHTEALLAWYGHFRTLRKPLPKDLTDRMETALAKWELSTRAQGTWTGQEDEAAAQMRAVLAMLRGEPSLSPPRQITDITDAAKLVEGIGKIAERIERMRAANAISEAELNRIVNNMSRVVDVLVPDQALKEKIREGWMQTVIR